MNIAKFGINQTNEPQHLATRWELEPRARISTTFKEAIKGPREVNKHFNHGVKSEFTTAEF
ncbi:MAG: hypothetical protein EBR84_02145 [Actinobacteria bacterium]|nr:hypothetical protein [Actinomycetota bacterium]